MLLVESVLVLVYLNVLVGWVLKKLSCTRNTIAYFVKRALLGKKWGSLAVKKIHERIFNLHIHFRSPNHDQQAKILKFFPSIDWWIHNLVNTSLKQGHFLLCFKMRKMLHIIVLSLPMQFKSLGV